MARDHRRLVTLTVEAGEGRMSDDLRAAGKYELAEYVASHKPMRFELWRGNDEGGLSGTGKVLEGMVFADGTVAIHWTTELWSVTFFPDWMTFYQIHTGGHPTNDTTIRFPEQESEWRQQ